jgi:hypothetical protein
MKLADSLRTLVSHVKNYEEKRIELFIAFGTKVPGKEDSYEVKTDAAGYDEFKKQIKEMEELEREVKLDSLTRGDLFGSSPDIDKQNQIPIDILSVFLEHGLLRE